MVNRIRERLGAGVIVVPEQAKAVFRSLKANRFVTILADQHAPASRVIIDFFGRPASVATGPALFAIRCDCPILPHVLIRENYDRHRVLKGPAIYPPHSGDREADISSMTMAYTGFLEETIRQHPDQWLWTHRRWKV